MACTNPQKMLFGTHMVFEEVGDWWNNARQRMEVKDIKITWVVFMFEFLEKYFPMDVRIKKEIEFLKLKQGNMTVVEYASNFEELVKFCPCYNSTLLKVRSI